MKHLLAVTDLSALDIQAILQVAIQVKREKKEGIFPQRLQHKNIALLFEKPSTRTRCAFAIAARDEGAHTEFLNPSDIHFGKKESETDTARVLGRFFDGIVFRGYKHSTVQTLSQYAGVPVWNALTDTHHPTQALADMMTLLEHFGDLAGRTCVYVGDAANNVAYSLALICALLGVHCTLSGPADRFPDPALWQVVCDLAAKTGAKLVQETDVYKAVRQADCIYTDVWVSMGEENDPGVAQRVQDLRPYQVSQQLMASTGRRDTVFLHCLPANKGLEVTADVFESAQSLVFDCAENRLHTIKAALLWSFSQSF